MTRLDAYTKAALILYQEQAAFAGRKARWFFAIGEDRKAIWFQHKQREAYQKLDAVREFFS